MRNTSLIAFLSIFILASFLAGCKKPVTPPVSERIAKAWTASKVDENSVTVYTRGVANPIRDYSKFKLDLSAAPTVKYTDYTGQTTFTGQYSVQSNTRLVLTNLIPELTTLNGSTNTIEFQIISIDDSNLTIKRTDTDLKTGSTTNTYTLTSP